MSDWPVGGIISDDSSDQYMRVIPALVAGAVCILFCGFLYWKLKKARVGSDIGQPYIDELAQMIKSGAKSFLWEEYKYLSFFVVALSLILFGIYFAKPSLSGVPGYTGSEEQSDGGRVLGAFLVGAILSGTAGFLGMMVATDANNRTTVACIEGSLNTGLTVAFTGGAIMGFTVVALGLLGLGSMYLLLSLGTTSLIGTGLYAGQNYSQFQTLQCLSGFGFGASSIALFARVAGGIYTKAADVGADLVGKVEAGIDEDDPHNPAVIADNVGDNVGDVAGMGADLFESYVGSIIAAATLGNQMPSNMAMFQGMGVDSTNVSAIANASVAYPFWISAFGAAASIVGFFFVSTKQEGKGWDIKLSTLMFALEKGIWISSFLFLGLAALVTALCYGADSEFGWRVYGCIVIGLVCGVAIGKVTEYFTSFDFGPVKSIKDRGVTGPATVIVQGLGVGMISTLPPTLFLAATLFSCNALAGQFGIAMAAVGMLATLGITLATDAYGPIADNAGGIAEMSGQDASVRAKTDSLDALGNTTAATGKGFAIGSAVLTSVSLLAAFKARVDPNNILFNNGLGGVDNPIVMAGLLLGAMMPFLFAALTMISVGKAAAEIIIEVRRQFREVKNENGYCLLDCIKIASEGKEIPADMEVKPESDKCVAISTRSALREMIAPGVYAIFSPVFVGFLVGPRCLVGFLAGSIVAGCMLAILMANAGGAWDNGKKLCEKLQIKKTEQGKACIVGDTVGDPFKDTSGPALNILIKLMSMVSLTIAPLIAENEDWQNFYYGFVPLAVILITTVLLICFDILGWQDPLKAEIEKAEQENTKEMDQVNTPATGSVH